MGVLWIGQGRDGGSNGGGVEDGRWQEMGIEKRVYFYLKEEGILRKRGVSFKIHKFSKAKGCALGKNVPLDISVCLYGYSLLIGCLF